MVTPLEAVESASESALEDLVTAPISEVSAAPSRGWFTLLRVRHWAHFLALPLAGFDRALPFAESLPALGRGAVISFAVLSFGYLINTVSDRGMDLDPRKNLLIGGNARSNGFQLPLAVLAASSLALSLHGPTSVTIAVAVCLACGVAYSIGPRLKAVPFVGTLMNAGNFAPLLFVGLAASGAPPRLWSLLFAFVGLLLQNQLVHEAADAEEDQRGKVRTTFLVLGQRGAAVLALLCGGLVLGATLHLLRRVGAPWPWALHALPYLTFFPAQLAFHGGSAERMARARLTQRWAAAASGLLLFALDP